MGGATCRAANIPRLSAALKQALVWFAWVAAPRWLHSSLMARFTRSRLIEFAWQRAMYANGPRQSREGPVLRAWVLRETPGKREGQAQRSNFSTILIDV